MRDPGTTSLYPANIGSGGSWVKGHGLAVGRGKKTYSGVLAQALLGEMSCWDDMPPKRSKDELEPPVHAMRDKERGHTHCNG